MIRNYFVIMWNFKHQREAYYTKSNIVLSPAVAILCSLRKHTRRVPLVHAVRAARLCPDLQLSLFWQLHPLGFPCIDLECIQSHRLLGAMSMGLVLDGPAALAAANGCQSLSTTPGTAGRLALLAIGRSFHAGRAAHHASTSCRPLG